MNMVLALLPLITLTPSGDPVAQRLSGIVIEAETMELQGGWKAVRVGAGNLLVDQLGSSWAVWSVDQWAHEKASKKGDRWDGRWVDQWVDDWDVQTGEMTVCQLDDSMVAPTVGLRVDGWDVP